MQQSGHVISHLASPLHIAELFLPHSSLSSRLPFVVAQYSSLFVLRSWVKLAPPVDNSDQRKVQCPCVHVIRTVLYSRFVSGMMNALDSCEWVCRNIVLVPNLTIIEDDCLMGCCALLSGRN
jgi:hypothetical protein